jgi:hypothetical protein
LNSESKSYLEETPFIVEAKGNKQMNKTIPVMSLKRCVAHAPERPNGDADVACRFVGAPLLSGVPQRARRN